MKAYYEQDGIQLFLGDCRDVLPTLADCSVDSIVTDPPYELGFMGKSWDRSGIAYQVEVWRECLRVLKPGGHLLAFGGSRTYHRLACAIEDAGFEIRDQIQYIYGSGFPKSLNVSKNLRDEGVVCICNEHNSNMRGLQNGIPNVEGVAETDQDANLLPPMQRSIARAGMGHARLQGAESQNAGKLFERGVTRLQESGVEGRCNDLAKARELCADQVRPLPASVSSNGAEGRVRDGAPSNHGPMDRTPANQNGSRSPRRSQSSEQPANESTSLAGQPQPQVSGAWPLCGRCGKPVVPDGLGSALKPAHEPIVLARKPLDSILIQNVLQHGTGGINVDGCRIQTDETLQAGSRRLGDGIKFGFCEPRTEYEQNDNGRWPANVIHDGSDEVVDLFPQTESGGGDKGNKIIGSQGYGSNGRSWESGTYAPNNGSAARFFYVAKASKEDREEGLEDLPIRSAGEVTDRQDGSDGLNSPRAGAGRTNGSRNHHPTVKPTELMRYLVRLVTPPSGTVLDPFGGSGSTAKACALEDFKAILIEKEIEYCEIAKRRAQLRQRRLMFA